MNVQKLKKIANQVRKTFRHLGEKCPTKMYRIGMRDKFGESGTAGELLHKYMLDGEGVYKQVKAFGEAD